MIPRTVFRTYQKYQQKLHFLAFSVAVFIIVALGLLGYIVYTTYAETPAVANNQLEEVVSESEPEEEAPKYDIPSIVELFQKVSKDVTYIGEGRYVVVWDTENHTFHDALAVNEDKPYNAASITKLITALTLAKEGVLTGGVVSDNGESHPEDLPEGEQVGNYKGQSFPQDDLVAALLIQSSNQAAYSLSDPVGEDAFRDKMNAYARKLGMSRSVLRDPSGYDFGKTTKASYMSPRDVARVAFELVHDYPEMTKLTTNKNYDITNTSGRKFALKNTNPYVLNMKNIRLSKTGYTNLAGGNLVVVTEPRPGILVAYVTMKSTQPGRFSDITKMEQNMDNAFDMYDLLKNK